MSFTTDDVKKLRELTGAGIMAAKKALEESSGDIDKAVGVLRLQGQASAAKRAGREARNGIIASYVHAEKVGGLVEVNCETDFVARTDDFKAFARDVAMHVVAMNPQVVGPDNLPEEEIERQKQNFAQEAGDAKAVAAKLEEYYRTVCLNKQPFVKDQSKTIAELTAEISAKVGENVVIRRFERMELGDSSD